MLGESLQADKQQLFIGVNTVVIRNPIHAHVFNKTTFVMYSSIYVNIGLCVYTSGKGYAHAR